MGSGPVILPKGVTYSPLLTHGILTVNEARSLLTIKDTQGRYIFGDPPAKPTPRCRPLLYTEALGYYAVVLVMILPVVIAWALGIIR